MYDFAKKLSAKPATEEMVESKSSTYTNNVSTEAQKMMSNATLSTIIRSFARRMCLRGVAKDEVIKSITDFVNICIRNGDIRSDEREYLTTYGNWSWASSTTDRVRSANNPIEIDSLWGFYQHMKESIGGTRSDLTSYCTELYDKLPDNERKLLEDESAAYERWHAARTAREQYFNKSALAVLKELFGKYADTLSHLDSELFEYVQRELKFDSNEEESVPAPELDTPVGM